MTDQEIELTEAEHIQEAEQQATQLQAIHVENIRLGLAFDVIYNSVWPKLCEGCQKRKFCPWFMTYERNRWAGVQFQRLVQYCEDCWDDSEVGEMIYYAKQNAQHQNNNNKQVVKVKTTNKINNNEIMKAIYDNYENKID